MRDRKVAARYAGALLISAKAEGVLVGVAESYTAVMELISSSQDMHVFMVSPQVAEQEKKDLLTNVLGGKIETVLLHFMYLLIDKNRIENFSDIGEEFVDLVEKDQGIIRAGVVTAVELADDLSDKLKAKLATLTGKQVILEKKIDPAVIGGVCVTMGDNILDGTLRTSLDELRKKLEQAPLATS